MLLFNRPSITALEKDYMAQAADKTLCGDGFFTKKATELLKQIIGKDMNGNEPEILLTTSGTHALEMGAMLAEIKEGDEVIMPSYTFVSTANAYLLRGAKIVFCDVDKRTMNLDANLIEPLITDKTKAIVPVHYAGVPCDMDAINNIANKHNIIVSEDAAQAVGSTYKGRGCGTLSSHAAFSFHESKNYVMGEGGALVVKAPEDMKRAEIMREKGTDRSLFMRGMVDKYTWRSPGSSYLPSDILAAMLCGQLERFNEILNGRMETWNAYHSGFEHLEQKGILSRPFIPDYATHNAHMYYLMLDSRKTRDDFIAFLKKAEIMSVFHYIPLHSAPVGLSLGYKPEDVPITEEYSGRIVRLPLWFGMQSENQKIVDKVCEFFV